MLLVHILGIGGGGEGRLGGELEFAPRGDDALAKRDRGDMPLPHRAQRHHDALRSLGHPRLIVMRHHAGVHQRRGGITVFQAEIGADQLALHIADLAAVEIVLRRDLVVARHEHTPRLPVPRLEILEHRLELFAGLVLGHFEHDADQPLRAADPRAVRLPAEMERPHHDARWVGVQPQPVVENLQNSPRRIALPMRRPPVRRPRVFALPRRHPFLKALKSRKRPIAARESIRRPDCG